MKCTIILDENREEEILIYAHNKSPLIDQIQLLAEENTTKLTGFWQDEIVKIDIKDVYCFVVDGGKVYAVCENEKYKLKARLYNIEETLDKDFIKINQSSIINVNKINKFDVSISGTLKVILKNGYTDYVSRRNIKLVKERLGL